MPRPNGPKKEKAMQIAKLSLDNPGMTRAAILESVGYAPTTARGEAAAIYNSPSVQEAFKDAMLARGLTPDKLAEKCAEGLEAWKLHSSPTEPDQPVPDFSVRHKYLQTLLKAQGLDGVTKHEIAGELTVKAKRDELTEADLERLINEEIKRRGEDEQGKYEGR